MHRRFHPLSGLLVMLAGCTTSTIAPNAEKTVREVFAERLNVKESAVPMDRPICDPPLNYDTLDLIELVMELEERHGVHVEDAALDRFLDTKPDSPPRITPNQLVIVLREASKLQDPMHKK